MREAGGLPLEGTSLDWELLKINKDGNDVVLDSSSEYDKAFVTPENGLVSIPLQVGGGVLETNGISGQSKLAIRIRPSKDSIGSFAQVGGTKGHCTNAANNVRYNYLSLMGMTSLEDCQRNCLKPNHNNFVGVEFSEGVERKCNCLHSGSSLPQCADFPSLIDPTGGDAGEFDTSFDIPKGDAGDFGTSDFRIEMDVMGRGFSPFENGIDHGALFIRSGENVFPYSGPSVFVNSVGDVTFRLRADDELLMQNALPDLQNEVKRHLVFSRLDNLLKAEIDGQNYTKTIVEQIANIESVKGAPLRFRGNHTVKQVQPLFVDVLNVELTPSPHNSSEFAQRFSLPIIRTCRRVFNTCGDVAKGPIGGLDPNVKTSLCDSGMCLCGVCVDESTKLLNEQSCSANENCQSGFCKNDESGISSMYLG